MHSMVDVIQKVQKGGDVLDRNVVVHFRISNYSSKLCSLKCL